jgi:tetratricopeptide (TPR) repeat protein
MAWFRSWRVVGSGVMLAWACGIGAALADEAPQAVIPPGREAAVERLLKGDGAVLPGGCRLSDAAIEESRVRATFACEAGPAAVVLRHPAGAAAGSPASASFALEVGEGVPRPFVDGLVARLRAGEAGWTWQMVTPKEPPPPPPEPEPTHWDPGLTGDEDLGICGPPSPIPPRALASGDPAALKAAVGEVAPQPRGDELTGEAFDLYMSTDPMMRTGEYQEIFDRMSALARRVPHNLVLGRLVVACAGLASHPKRHNEIVEGFLADADAHPDDALKQFIAGVSVHYRGHQHAATREQKKADYERCIHYLERAKVAYPNVSRVWLYLAISYYRTGQQAQAEAAIEKALAVDPGSDADIYYSRAEIEHLKDIDKTLADLRHYASVMDENRKKGGYSAPHKDALVHHMFEHFEKVKRGETTADAEDLFDPVATVVVPDGPNGPEGGTGQPAAQGGGGVNPMGMTAEAQAAFDKSQQLILDGKIDEAYRLILEVAYREPANLILTRLGVTVARSTLTAETVAAFRKAADEAPTDAVRQLVAGIAMHYYAHGTLSAGPERQAAYEASIPYLQAAAKAFPHSDRAWLYLAVTKYRLGRAAEAEAAITHAFELNPDAQDPDLFYCRAEIYHRKDLARSIADLEQYHARMEQNIAAGAIHAPEKEARVVRTIAALKRIQAGEGSLDAADPFVTDSDSK